MHGMFRANGVRLPFVYVLPAMFSRTLQEHSGQSQVPEVPSPYVSRGSTHPRLRMQTWVLWIVRQLHALRKGPLLSRWRAHVSLSIGIMVEKWK